MYVKPPPGALDGVVQYLRRHKLKLFQSEEAKDIVDRISSELFFSSFGSKGNGGPNIITIEWAVIILKNFGVDIQSMHETKCRTSRENIAALERISRLLKQYLSCKQSSASPGLCWTE